MKTLLHIIPGIITLSFNIACTNQLVSYSQDIEPILKDKCIKCHTPPDGIGYKKTGLKMTSYNSLMEGTIYGPVIHAGDSRRSIINMLIEGRAGKLQQILHDDGTTLSKEEIMLLKQWVDQGALHN